MKRSTQGAINNPVTGLPEGALVDERLSECLENRDWGIVGISLEKLEVFRETYGFVASDDVLRAVSLMIRNAVSNVGSPLDFVGHLGPFEFVVVTSTEYIETLSNRIKTRLEQSLDYFYPLKDRIDESNQPENRLVLRIRILDSKIGTFNHINQLKKFLVEG